MLRGFPGRATNAGLESDSPAPRIHVTRVSPWFMVISRETFPAIVPPPSILALVTPPPSFSGRGSKPTSSLSIGVGWLEKLLLFAASVKLGRNTRVAFLKLEETQESKGSSFNFTCLKG